MTSSNVKAISSTQRLDEDEVPATEKCTLTTIRSIEHTGYSPAACISPRILAASLILKTFSDSTGAAKSLDSSVKKLVCMSSC